MTRTLTLQRVGITLIMAMTLTMLAGAFAAPASAQDFDVTTVGTEAGFGTEDLSTTIGRLIKVALSLLGIIALVIILLGGFKWMTAAGNEEKVTEAKKLLIAGVIGILIILSAYAITTFVLGSLQSATGGTAVKLE